MPCALQRVPRSHTPASTAQGDQHSVGSGAVGLPRGCLAALSLARGIIPEPAALQEDSRNSHSASAVSMERAQTAGTDFFLADAEPGHRSLLVELSL